jgi:hypothetical protein
LPLIREEMWIRNSKQKKLRKSRSKINDMIKVSNCVNIDSLTKSVNILNVYFLGLKNIIMILDKRHDPFFDGVI